MRVINDIIVHCSGNSIKDGKSAIHAADIVRMHKETYGWKRCGYHYIVECDGTIVHTEPDSVITSHCKRHNAHSIGICYIGGNDAHGNPLDTRTPAQKSALLKMIYQLITLYRCPVHGHRDYSSKPCPSFDAKAEYKSIYEKIIGISRNNG